MNSQPRCPDPLVLRKLINNLGGEDASTLEIINALDWLATHLENRNLYHKKQTIKNKIRKSLLEQHNLLEQVDKLTDTALFNHVSEQPPDADIYNPRAGMEDDE